MTPITHQFTLFDYNNMRPKRKIPISRARIEEAKRLFNNGDYTGSAIQLRRLREALENYESRIR